MAIKRAKCEIDNGFTVSDEPGAGWPREMREIIAENVAYWMSPEGLREGAEAKKAAEMSDADHS